MRNPSIRFRTLSATALALAVAPAPLSAALTPANSIVAPFSVEQRVNIEGAGCGVPASATLALPTGAQDVRVAKPKVGDTSGDARLTAISAEDGGIRLTAVADSPDTCQGTWDAAFFVEASYRLRVPVGLWNDWSERNADIATRPRKVRIPQLGVVVGMRWKRFGAAKAVGHGTLKLDSPPGGPRCNPRNCLGHGRRFRVELTRPSRCPEHDFIFYGRVTFITTRQVGVIKPGRLFAGRKPECALTKPDPV